MDADLFIKLIERLGLPLALVFGETVAIVALLKWVAKMMEGHARERGEVMAAHLAAISTLSEKVDASRADLQRVLDRLPLRATGRTNLSTLAVLAFLALAFSLGCHHVEERRLDLGTAIHAESAAVATVEAREEKHEAQTVATVETRAPSHVETHAHFHRVFAATPAAPAYVEEEDRETAEVSGAVSIDTHTTTAADESQAEKKTTAETTRTDATAQVHTVAKSATDAGPSVFHVLIFGGLALAVVSFGAAFVRRAGGVSCTLSLVAAIVRRLFRGVANAVQGKDEDRS